MGLGRLLFTVSTLAFGAGLAHAGFDFPFSDLKLAQSPIFVIGYWPKPASVPRNAFYMLTANPTELVVTRVIHGDLTPGKYKLTLVGLVDWSSSGSGPFTHGSGGAYGDVQNVTKPHIWFLQAKKDEGGRTQLYIENYRSVQNTDLLPFYEVLRGKDRDSRIRECLESRNADVVRRALDYVADNRTVAPFWIHTPEEEPELRTHLEQEAEIAGLKCILDAKSSRYPSCNADFFLHKRPDLLVICRDEYGWYRTLAAATYAEKAGPSSVILLRKLLKDADPDVALVAALYLVKSVDTDSLPAIESACKRAKSRFLAVTVIDVMQKSRNLRYVPALAAFLQSRAVRSLDSSDKASPAISAQHALADLTSFVFPFDCEASVRAWSSVSGLSHNERADRLRKLLGSWDSPLEAEALTMTQDTHDVPRTAVEVRVTNRTDHPVSLMSIPTLIDESWSYTDAAGKRVSSAGENPYPGIPEPAPGFFHSGPPVKPKVYSPKLITIEPGKSTRFTVFLGPDIVSETSRAKVGITYADTDVPAGSKAWIGELDVKLVK